MLSKLWTRKHYARKALISMTLQKIFVLKHQEIGRIRISMSSLACVNRNWWQLKQWNHSSCLIFILIYFYYYHTWFTSEFKTTYYVYLILLTWNCLSINTTLSYAPQVTGYPVYHQCQWCGWVYQHAVCRKELCFFFICLNFPFFEYLLRVCDENFVHSSIA